ncbi:MAG: tRNA (adenosine(37)-N6)-dimethylallyltransferase MiaA [Gammaproteobacteria bacterium]
MTDKKQHPIICLMGPTASGKTQLAVNLVQQLPCEIISVDSQMVYRDMDIGTAKPDPAILKIAPHRLINIRDPKDAYSAAQFRDDAIVQIKDIFNAQKIPLLVGGTMLYFRALQQGLSDMPSADVEVREKISATAAEVGWAVMHERLAVIDPVAAKRIHPHDSQRIQRALEVYEITGKNLSTWQQASGEALTDYQVINIAIAPHNRAILHDRIAARFKQMLEDGLVDEARRLFLRGDLDVSLPAIRSVGYRQVWEFLLGQLSYEEMQERGIIATRQLAKRQLTWLRSWPDVVWFDSEAVDLDQQVLEYLRRVL